MADFPSVITRDGDLGILSPFVGTPLGEMMAIANNSCSNVSTTWTANRAVYFPVCVNRPLTVYDIGIVVVTQNGNVDAGFYTWSGTRIVSNGGTAVGAAGAQVLTLADTVLTPGWYHLGFACSSATAVFKACNLATPAARAGGVQQQSSAYPLPDPMTPAAYSVGIFPQISASIRSVF